MTNERRAVAIPVVVHDVSGREDRFSLANCGFQLHRRQTRAAACLAGGYHDAALIKTAYYDDCVALLMDV